MTDEMCNRILDMIADGASVRSACAKADVPKSTFLRTVDPQRYAIARDACADAHFDDLVDLALDIKDGKVDAAAGRVAADILKWRVSRMRPQMYGDKTSVEHSGAVEHTHSLTPAVSELIERIKGER